MHGVGKGRKPGARNKTVAERIIDLVVMSSGGNHSDTLNILQDHWNAHPLERIGDRILFEQSLQTETSSLTDTCMPLAWRRLK